MYELIYVPRSTAGIILELLGFQGPVVIFVFTIILISVLLNSLGFTGFNALFTPAILIIFIIDIVGVVILYLFLIGTHYILDRSYQRIVRMRTMIMHSQHDFPINTFREANLQQSVYGRLFNYGSINLVSNNPKQTLLMRFVFNPNQYVPLIQQMIAQKSG